MRTSRQPRPRTALTAQAVLLPGEALKNLRHFNATQLLAAGVDLRTTAGRLGHSDGGATTLRVYANWTRPADQRAAELLSADLTALRQRTAATARAERSRARGVARTRKPAADVLTDPNPPQTYVELAERLRSAIEAERLALQRTMLTPRIASRRPLLLVLPVLVHGTERGGGDPSHPFTHGG